MKLPDISEYYTLDRAVAEEHAWSTARLYIANAVAVHSALQTYNAKSVIELGCGSGWVAAQLPKSLWYVGVDQNPTFLLWAKQRNPDRLFIKLDIRDLPLSQPFDLVCSFALMKHFGLHEWSDRIRGMLRLAPTAVFDMQIADRDLDNGTEYHHVFVTDEHMRSVISDAGHEVVDQTVTAEGPIPGNGYGRTVLFTTRAIS